MTPAELAKRLASELDTVRHHLAAASTLSDSLSVMLGTDPQLFHGAAAEQLVDEIAETYREGKDAAAGEPAPVEPVPQPADLAIRAARRRLDEASR